MQSYAWRNLFTICGLCAALDLSYSAIAYETRHVPFATCAAACRTDNEDDDQGHLAGDSELYATFDVSGNGRLGGRRGAGHG
eukprot:3085915-Pleurochrysis_carterae.AAC.2